MCYKWDKLQRLMWCVCVCVWEVSSQDMRGRIGRLGLCVWEENRYNFKCMCERVCLISLHICILLWHREVDIWQRRIYDCSAYTGWTNTTYTVKEMKTSEALVSDTPKMLITSVCLSTRFHLFPWSWHTWQWRGWKWLVRVDDAVQRCQSLPWKHMADLQAHWATILTWHWLTHVGRGRCEEELRRGHRPASLCHQMLPVPPSALEGHKTSATMLPPNPNPSYPLGLWPAWMPATPAHSTARPTPKRTKPNTNFSTLAPFWATHPITDKLKYH